MQCSKYVSCILFEKNCIYFVHVNDCRLITNAANLSTG